MFIVRSLSGMLSGLYRLCGSGINSVMGCLNYAGGCRVLFLLKVNVVCGSFVAVVVV